MTSVFTLSLFFFVKVEIVKCYKSCNVTTHSSLSPLSPNFSVTPSPSGYRGVTSSQLGCCHRVVSSSVNLNSVVVTVEKMIHKIMTHRLQLLQLLQLLSDNLSIWLQCNIISSKGVTSSQLGCCHRVVSSSVNLNSVVVTVENLKTMMIRQIHHSKTRMIRQIHHSKTMMIRLTCHNSCNCCNCCHCCNC